VQCRPSRIGDFPVGAPIHRTWLVAAQPCVGRGDLGCSCCSTFGAELELPAAACEQLASDTARPMLPTADAVVSDMGSADDGLPDAPLDIFGPGEESGTFDSFGEIVRPDYTSSPDDNVMVEPSCSQLGVTPPPNSNNRRTGTGKTTLFGPSRCQLAVSPASSAASSNPRNRLYGADCCEVGRHRAPTLEDRFRATAMTGFSHRSGRSSAFTSAINSWRSEKVPFVSGDVDKHGETSIRLAVWFGEELDIVLHHMPVSAIEVLDTKKEPDASCVLVADRRSLAVAIGLGQKETGASAWRTNDDPPLRSPVACNGRGVFDQLESQCRDVEVDCMVVVIDDHCGVFDVHSPNLRTERRGQKLRTRRPCCDFRDIV
jgi:hypothetical protein